VSSLASQPLSSDGLTVLAIMFGLFFGLRAVVFVLLRRANRRTR
jgi:hypothetical protein